MLHLLESIETSLNTKNWEAALLMAINLPDVCAALEGIQKQGKTNRYVLWARKWLQPKYTRKVFAAPPLYEIEGGGADMTQEERTRFLSEVYENAKVDMVSIYAEDLYALRCAFTHAAEHDLSNPKINQTLSRFIISSPPDAHSKLHLNYVKLKHDKGEEISLQIQVDIFCREICDAVRSWLVENKDNENLNSKLAAMARINPSSTLVVRI
ncbi:hypothetical protein [Agrobacterium pusense]|jgi:hypothetical protein|uniref:hypothetical protein n=1 Tax=Agrobacterium pusense TaxID=648995 RepID=UPI0037C13ABB